MRLISGLWGMIMLKIITQKYPLNITESLLEEKSLDDVNLMEISNDRVQ